MPSLASSVFVDPAARIMGAVALGDNSSVWAGAVVRGDDAGVTVGPGAAILENCVVEAPGGHPVNIGANCIVSHAAVVHGATVEDDALVGIGAIVLDDAVVGRGSIVGAGAVVAPRTVLPPDTLALGTPARVVRELTQGERESVREEVARLALKAAQYRTLFAINDNG